MIQAQDVSDFLVNSGMTAIDSEGVRRPILAETVPSLDNGLWKLLPNGQMELIWKIRPNTQWHDGTPLTADDLMFTIAVASDREMPEFRNGAFDVLDHADVIDAQTLSTTWKQPFIRADRLFSGGITAPASRCRSTCSSRRTWRTKSCSARSATGRTTTSGSARSS